MKSFILISVLLCGTSLASLVIPQQYSDLTNLKTARGINDQVRAAIENLLHRMPCGIPEMNMPIMAPYQRNYTELGYDNKLLELVGSFFDTRVDGLNVMDIDDIKFSLTLKANFDFNFPEIRARNEYVANLILLKFMRFSGNGNMDITLKDLRLTGSLQIGVIAEHLYLKDFQIVIKLGSLKSDISGLLWGKWTGKLANKAFEIFIPGMISKHQADISAMIQAQVIETANTALADLTTQDLIDKIMQGSEPVECIPPPQ